LSHVYSDDDGKLLVKLARDTVELYVKEGEKPAPPDNVPDHLRRKSGVFVTLNRISGEKPQLRGCIGRPYPTEPLIVATINSAVDAAVNDPRFPPVSPSELEEILIELSVLTPPQKIDYSDPQELISKVKIGRDGLIASREMRRGLLLPQVPVEWNWDVKEYLKHTCNKAGLPADAWRDPGTEFLSFQAEIFGEESPRGDIKREHDTPAC
jgi:hypothetical protein